MKKIASTALALSLALSIGSQTSLAAGKEREIPFENPGLEQLQGKDINTIIEENQDNLTQADIDLSLLIIKLKEENLEISTDALVGLVESNFSGEIQAFGVLESAGKTWSNLTAAEKWLVALHPADALLVKAAQSRTDKITSERYPNWKDGDKGNAFRHALWNAQMARNIGKNLAEQFATAHENHGLTDAEYKAQVWFGFNGLEHKNMDLHNNKMGRDCFYWYDIAPFDSTLADRVDAKIKNGEAKILVK
ncbi:DUF6973 domain-containing protein [Sporosarcina limicola]|uniref:DUF6973 domain-containing protein n=1 Tax=Sporosarcina limicola TaxID=34101 RepID=A0A927MNB0_9BACL|nr:hypothetical protein [Sporosarcina limicola]MBE1557166.1 hypothetical protein [Sporosarcina limicola]